ncbi:hypothetical protein GCM10009117_02720 [Gangjinia marincola]|uniref:Viral A-type inclusion protein n=1 Tax=Gangjinia marincola TaxID=578463 RepID=A0ABN1MDG2_9FLAO
MKNFKSSTTLLLIVLICLGCVDEKKPEKDTAAEKTESSPNEISQMQRVVNIHDELMPKMGSIGMLSSQLKMKDSIQYQEQIAQLEYSHDAMMEWMKDFGTKFNSDEIMKGAELSQEKQVMLDIEEEEVLELQILMNSSIEAAKESLKKEE